MMVGGNVKVKRITKILIAGSRKFGDCSVVKKFLDEREHLREDTLILNGGASGIDKAVRDWCNDNGVPCKVIRPVNPQKKEDYLYRNIEMITMATGVIVFWDGESRGTKFVIDYAKARDKLIDHNIVMGKPLNQLVLNDV